MADLFSGRSFQKLQQKQSAHSLAKSRPLFMSNFISLSPLARARSSLSSATSETRRRVALPHFSRRNSGLVSPDWNASRRARGGQNRGGAH